MCSYHLCAEVLLNETTKEYSGSIPEHCSRKWWFQNNFFWIYGADVCMQLIQRLLFTLHLCGNSSAFHLIYGNSIVTILARVKKKKIYSSWDKQKRTPHHPGGFDSSRDLNLWALWVLSASTERLPCFPMGLLIPATHFKTMHGWMLMLLCTGFEVIELPPELRF